MTIKYYTQSQIDQQAGIIGQRLRGLTVDLTEYIDASVMSTEERQKLASLESSKFLGTFLTSGEIPLDKAVPGSYADVDAGPGETVSRWIYDADNGVFVKATGEVAGETSVSVKEKYESNPDTNAFTDNHKTALEALQGLAPATSIESFLEAFNLAMGTTAAAQASVLNLLSSETNYANTAFHAEYQVNDEPWVTRTFNGTAEETPETAMDKFLDTVTQATSESYTTDLTGVVEVSDAPLIINFGNSWIYKEDRNFPEGVELPITFLIVKDWETGSYSISGVSPTSDNLDTVEKEKVTVLRFRPSNNDSIDLIQDRFGGEVEVTSTAKAYFIGV